mmetsp:Transcript_109901/g.342597  ORF Transcript_109901/g.342597 Transcript_109901/m.342597 type:complete len:573 (-) Transcript_109901:154-1872(-)
MAGPRVCVIGAGAAGLTTIKQLKDQGVTIVDCFEKESEEGGIFFHGEQKNGVYDNATLTISNYLMAFSDMPPTGHRFHWHHSEYKQYLRQYAEEFDLLRHIAFGTVVTSVAGGPGCWHVIVQTGSGEIVDKGVYDAVAICSGAHQAVNQPQFPGMETFTGQVSHSSTYKNNAPFVGKDCVCVGLGESGADIVREVSDVASGTVLAMRSFPYLIPRLVRPFHENPLGCPSDAFTSHLRHDLLLVPLSHYRRFCHLLNRLVCTLAAFLYLLLPCLGRPSGGSAAKDAFQQDAGAGYIDKDTRYSNVSASLIYAWCNWSGQGERGQKFACKNVTFVENVVQGKIRTNISGIERLDGDRVLFKDGASAKCDCLIMCTGYRDVFPFLKGTIGASETPLAVTEGNVRRLYKHIIHPEIGHTMAWIGFVRPSTGGIPACAEMAARYFALLLVGKRQLPRGLAERTARDFEDDSSFYRLSPDVRTLVGYKDWMDSMAEHVGCGVRLHRYLLQPRLLVRLCLGSLLPSQYRLSGPGALPELAKAVVLSQPVASSPGQCCGEAVRAWRRHLDPRKLLTGANE